MVDAFKIDRARPAHHADDLIAILQQKLGQIAAVLPRDTRDQCGWHFAFPLSLLLMIQRQTHPSGRTHLNPPPVQEIAQRVLQVDLWFPTGSGLESAVITNTD